MAFSDYESFDSSAVVESVNCFGHGCDFNLKFFVVCVRGNNV